MIALTFGFPKSRSAPLATLLLLPDACPALRLAEAVVLVHMSALMLLGMSTGFTGKRPERDDCICLSVNLNAVCLSSSALLYSTSEYRKSLSSLPVSTVNVYLPGRLSVSSAKPDQMLMFQVFKFVTKSGWMACGVLNSKIEAQHACMALEEEEACQTKVVPCKLNHMICGGIALGTEDEQADLPYGW